jgi:hypothetical protein
MYHALTLNGYSNFINAVKRQRNLGLIICVNKLFYERMMKGDSPEVITKTGNTTIKKMKTHKKDPGRQNRKRPS